MKLLKLTWIKNRSAAALPPVPVPLSLLTNAPPRGDAFNVRGCYSTAMVMAAGDAPAFRKLT